MGKVFGTYFRARLESLGLNVNQAAERSGISNQLLYRLRDGERKATGRTIAKLAEILELPTSTLQAWADADELGPERMKHLILETAGERPPEVTSFLGRDRAQGLLREFGRPIAQELTEASPDSIYVSNRIPTFDPSSVASSAPIGAPPPGASPLAVQAIEWLNALPPEERLAELRYLEERVRRLQREKAEREAVQGEPEA